MVSLISLGLAIVALLATLGTVLLNRQRRRYAYARGYADAGARLIGAAAAELGHDSPVVDRMLASFGHGAPEL